MKDFKQLIRSNLEQQSYREAESSDWQAFLEYSAHQKKKSFLFSWKIIGFFSIGLLLAVSSYLLSSEQTPLANHPKSLTAGVIEKSDHAQIAVQKELEKNTLTEPKISEDLSNQKFIQHDSQLHKNSSSTNEPKSKTAIKHIIQTNIPVQKENQEIITREKTINNNHYAISSTPAEPLHQTTTRATAISNHRVPDIVQRGAPMQLAKLPVFQAAHLSSKTASRALLDIPSETIHKKFRGMKLELGILTGLSTLNYTDLMNSTGIESGILLNYVFSDKIKFLSRSSISRLLYMSDTFIPEIGLRRIDSPTPMHSIESLEASTDILNIALGLQYSVWKHNAFSFHLSSSAGLEKTLQRDIQYGFQGEQEGENEDEEEVEIQDQNLEGLGLHFQFRLGTAYAINSRYSLELEGYFQDQITHTFNRPKQLGLYASLLYGF